MSVSSSNFQWTVQKGGLNSVRQNLPLRHRICWRWCIRYLIAVTLWASLASFVWISRWTSCDSRHSAENIQAPSTKALKLQNGQVEDDTNKLPQADTLSDISRIDTVHFSRELVHQFEQDAKANSLSYVYKKQWAGFPDLVGADCPKALSGKASNNQYPQTVKRIRPFQYIQESQDCNVLLEKYGFNRYPEASQEEKEFPIAFIILFYKDLDQVLFLLRALFQPHNVYCLTIDTKASFELYKAVKSVAKCLPNVFLASKLESIVYAGFTRLMADIDCMDDLLRHPVQWKYIINMPGTQFPLRTNLEMVKILKIFNGANDIEGLTGDMLVADRYQYKHVYVTDKETGELRIKNAFVPNDSPPHQLAMIKGSTYGTFSRAFVQFALQDPVAKDFLEWSKNIKSPDEYFWGTLHHSKTLNVPGGFKGEPHKKPWLTSFSLWETNPNHKCATMYIHKICIFSPEDFPIFIHRGQLFANKFYITHHPAALHCLDEMIVNLTYSGVARDLSFYKRVPFAIKSDQNNSKH